MAKGSYLDDIDGQIQEMQAHLRRDTRRTIRLLIGFITITCVCFLALAFVFSRKIRSLFEGYQKIQQEQQSKLEELNAALEVQATTDAMTQTYNRGYFNTRIVEEMRRSQRYAHPLSLVLFDVDHFKKINDIHGHLAGDEVLKSICRLCLENIRASDILARWGGEEFMILVPEDEKGAAKILAEKLRVMIENHTFSIESRITCSFGVACFDGTEGKDDFISRTDRALYRSKKDGRNRVTVL